MMPVGRSYNKTHLIGAKAEEAALAFLQAQGLVLVAQNWHQAQVGEIDIVMTVAPQRIKQSSVPNDKNKPKASLQLTMPTLVFVEVRKRKNMSYGGALASVTTKKQAKIIATAACFLAEHPEYNGYDCRFDVVAIEAEQLHWLPSAFIL